MDLGASFAAPLRARPICVRFDLLWPAGRLAGVEVPGLRKSPLDIQPSSTVLIDLHQSPDDLLAQMHKKNRYNVGLSRRKGVLVAEVEEGLERWYRMYRETAERDRISIHPFRYYERLFQIARDSPHLTLHLYLAEHDGDLLAGIIVAHLGDHATYLYGASSNCKRELMPNYALQWHALQAAREAGMAVYDLFGVPPADDPAHPMHGLYRFKTGFGGSLVHREGSWDVVIQPVSYRLYRVAERARAYYFHHLRKAGAR